MNCGDDPASITLWVYTSMSACRYWKLMWVWGVDYAVDRRPTIVYVGDWLGDPLCGIGHLASVCVRFAPFRSRHWVVSAPDPLQVLLSPVQGIQHVVYLVWYVRFRLSLIDPVEVVPYLVLQPATYVRLSLIYRSSGSPGSGYLRQTV